MPENDQNKPQPEGIPNPETSPQDQKQPTQPWEGPDKVIAATAKRAGVSYEEAKKGLEDEGIFV